METGHLFSFRSLLVLRDLEGRGDGISGQQIQTHVEDIERPEWDVWK